MDIVKRILYWTVVTKVLLLARENDNIYILTNQYYTRLKIYDEPLPLAIGKLFLL